MFILNDEVEQGIRRLTLNDTATRNAMSEEMAAEFEAHVQSLCADDQTSVVILTGSGDAFSAGGHLEMLLRKASLSLEENKIQMDLFYSQFLSIRKIPVPVIAAISGPAVGAGLCLALACDIRVATESSKLGFNFVRIGLHPGMGATFFLPRLLGSARARELLFTGSMLQAPAAKSLGLLSEVWPHETFEKNTLDLARLIRSNGREALRRLKLSLNTAEEAHLSECLDREARSQALDYGGEDFKKRILAVREKKTS